MKSSFISSIHILLTYECTKACDHCFVYSRPGAGGSFSIDQVRKLLLQIKELPSITSVYFEGGEPFTDPELLIHSVRMADEMGFDIGIVTNGYWAKNREDALIILKRLKKWNIVDLSISDDELHRKGQKFISPIVAYEEAKRLEFPVGIISISEEKQFDKVEKEKGQQIMGGDIRLRGRAVETYGDKYLGKDTLTFNNCPHENLITPSRVHVDVHGNIQICQGLVIGNYWERSLKEIFEQYDPYNHPIIKYLENGGPIALANTYNYDISGNYLEECHLCFIVRKELVDKFPKELAPRQVYGY